MVNKEPRLENRQQGHTYVRNMQRKPVSRPQITLSEKVVLFSIAAVSFFLVFLRCLRGILECNTSPAPPA
eukprot:155319-Pelagomonas_calceolata.AAC.5